MATTGANRTVVLSLYRQLLRESNAFESYIYRKYALRRIRDSFRHNKNISDDQMIAQLVSDGHKSLQLIRRQVVVNRLYKSDKLVVEGIQTANNT